MVQDLGGHHLPRNARPFVFHFQERFGGEAVGVENERDVLQPLFQGNRPLGFMRAGEAKTIRLQSLSTTVLPATFSRLPASLVV